MRLDPNVLNNGAQMDSCIRRKTSDSLPDLVSLLELLDDFFFFESDPLSSERGSSPVTDSDSER